MPRITYVPREFNAASETVIEQANNIIEIYEAQGYNLTLRQLYYQFVSRDLLRNRQTEYKRLGSIINDARLAGRLDWDSISDRTRAVRSSDYEHGNPDTWLRRIADGFSKSYWDEQPEMIEVWVEKDALVEIAQRACEPYRVPYFACRGYVSQSEMWGAAQRIEEYGKPTTIIHLGDHDPSGIDMSRDIEDRLTMFCQGDGYDAPTVRRIALNWDQVQQYGPPPNPAKLTDSRGAGYVDRFGDESWELDALEPSVINDLIQNEIGLLVDNDAWSEVEKRETEARDRIKLVGDRWSEVINWLDRSA